MKTLTRVSTLAVSLTLAGVVTASGAAAAAAPGAVVLYPQTGQSLKIDPAPDCVPLGSELQVVGADNETNFRVNLYPTDDCSGDASGTLAPGDEGTFDPAATTASVRFVGDA